MNSPGGENVAGVKRPWGETAGGLTILGLNVQGGNRPGVNPPGLIVQGVKRPRFRLFSLYNQG